MNQQPRMPPSLAGESASIEMKYQSQINTNIRNVLVKEKSIVAWCVEVYAFDGTHIVVDRLAGREHPFYRVFGPGGAGNDSLDDRLKMAEDLRDHLRGGLVSSWLHDMERHRMQLTGADGSAVIAAGPYIEQTKGKLTRFVESKSDDAFERRYALIDRLVEACHVADIG